MLKLTWNDIKQIHLGEKNPRRTLWRVIGYGIKKKGRMGYTADGINFIIEKNFGGFTREEWGIACMQMIKAGQFITIKKNGKTLITLSEEGMELFEKKYCGN